MYADKKLDGALSKKSIYLPRPMRHKSKQNLRL